MNLLAWVLETGKFSVEQVCNDCTMAHENGDISGNDKEWDVEQYERTLELYDVNIGHLHDNPWYTECSHHGKPCSDDCDCERDYFSTAECGMCGTTLHGERHDYLFIQKVLLQL